MLPNTAPQNIAASACRLHAIAVDDKDAGKEETETVSTMECNFENVSDILYEELEKAKSAKRTLVWSECCDVAYSSADAARLGHLVDGTQNLAKFLGLARIDSKQQLQEALEKRLAERGKQTKDVCFGVRHEEAVLEKQLRTLREENKFLTSKCGSLEAELCQEKARNRGLIAGSRAVLDSHYETKGRVRKLIIKIGKSKYDEPLELLLKREELN